MSGRRNPAPRRGRRRLAIVLVVLALIAGVLAGTVAARCRIPQPHGQMI